VECGWAILAAAPVVDGLAACRGTAAAAMAPSSRLQWVGLTHSPDAHRSKSAPASQQALRENKGFYPGDGFMHMPTKLNIIMMVIFFGRISVCGISFSLLSWL